MAHLSYKKVTHCIFDLDGLILDNEFLYTQAIQMVLEPFGKTFTFDIKLKCMGLDASALGEFIVSHYELPMTAQEYIRSQDKNTKMLMTDCKLMPGAERLIRHLNAYRIPIAVATGSSKTSYEHKTRPHRELFKCFNHVVCASSDPEVEHGKPWPDVFLAAAMRFPCKPRPECCLVFEDSPNGLEAGVRAGMQVIMVPDPRLPMELSANATQRLNSLNCFKPQDFGIPSFRNDWMK